MKNNYYLIKMYLVINTGEKILSKEKNQWYQTQEIFF